MSNFTHRFTDKISINTSYMKQTRKEDLQEHRTTNAFAVDNNNNPIPTFAAMQMVQRDQFWNTDNLNTYLTFDVKQALCNIKFWQVMITSALISTKAEHKIQQGIFTDQRKNNIILRSKEC